MASLYCCHLHNACLERECCRGRMRSLVVSAWFNICNFQRKPRLEFSQAYKWWVERFNEKQLMTHCIRPAPTSDSNWRLYSYKSCSVAFRVQLTFESVRSRVTILVEFPKDGFLRDGSHQDRKIFCQRRTATSRRKTWSCVGLPLLKVEFHVCLFSSYTQVPLTCRVGSDDFKMWSVKC